MTSAPKSSTAITWLCCDLNIISIDLPWNPATKGRRYLAIAGPDRKIALLSARDDAGMTSLAREHARPPALVLMDISIRGIDRLNGQHFRPVDKALMRLGFPLLPSSTSGNRGKELSDLLQPGTTDITVLETYPYATYKFLAFLREKGRLGEVRRNEFRALLDDDFIRYWPPKYKRESNRQKRRENLRYIYGLLRDVLTSLNYYADLPSPDGPPSLDNLGDVYDACLGLIPAILYTHGSPFGRLAGDPDSGMILVLADRWLSEKIDGKVPVSS